MADTLPLNTSRLDLPVRLLNDADYASISMKDMSSRFPQALYDNGSYPLRTLSVWPVPSQNAVLILWLWQPLVSSLDLDAEVSFPPGYERALRFNLAIEIAAEFGKEIPPQVKFIADDSKGKIKRLNATSVSQLLHHSNWNGGGFSIYSGGFFPFGGPGTGHE